MNGTQTFNVNAAECLRDVAQFGTTHIHNVCTGVVTTVPWGISEWAATGLFSLLGVIALGVLALFVWAVTQ